MEGCGGLTIEDVMEVCGDEMVKDTEQITLDDVRFDEVVRKEEKNNRFAITSQKELEEDNEKSIPKNTRDKIKWAIKIYRTWLAEWRVRFDDSIPKVLKPMEEFTHGDLDYALVYFYCEVKKVNGERYPPQILKEIASAIQHFFNHTLKWNISLFLDRDFKNQGNHWIPK